MKYKVGDKVIYKNGTYFSNGEKIATITKITKSDCGDYYLIWVNSNGWVGEEQIELYFNTWTFNLEEYRDEDIVINCESEEESIKLFKILINNGITRWLDDTDLNKNDTEYGDYEDKICYSMNFENRLSFCDINFYTKQNYKIYKFSEIDFSQIWSKENIEEVALNNPVKCLKCINNENDNLNLTIGKQYKMYDKDNSGYLVADDRGVKSWYSKIRFDSFDSDNKDFEVTKIKSITLDELLSNRQFKTGDIVVDDEKHVGILLDNKVIYINTTCQEPFNAKSYCNFIPVENIKGIPYFINDLSKYFNSKDYSLLEDYFIKLEELPKLKTICSVAFTAETNTTKDFILEYDNYTEIEIGNIIECCTGSAYQYGRVVDIIQKELSEHDINTYRTCRKLSN